MTKYEELKTFIEDLQEREEKLPWTKVAEEHAKLEKRSKKHTRITRSAARRPGGS